MLPKNNAGQVYIGIAISLGLLAILSQAIITLIFSSYDLLNFTSSRTTAKYIASEQMELIKNLPFDDVGTIGGIPNGVLEQNKTVTQNGLTYTVNTSVIYVDDEFDSLAPDDLLPTDYKKARVDVSWGGLAQSKSATVTLITDIAPKGVETTTGGGTLSVLVFDSQGNPVGQASVNIIATSTTPPINLTLQTGNNGRIILPGAPQCDSCYQITVTKNGYSTDKTYTSSEVANPIRPLQSIIESQLTQVSFSIDLTSTLTINSTNSKTLNYSSLPNQPFRLRSQKTIGTDVSDDPIYKYDENLTTDSNGQLVLQNMEWGNYDFIPLNSSYDLSGANPLTPIVLLANTPLTFKYALNAHSNNSLRAIFRDQSNNLIASVAAQISDISGPVASDSSGISQNPDFGQIFFADLASSNYLLEATISGYQNVSTNININGQSTEEIILTPQ